MNKLVSSFAWTSVSHILHVGIQFLSVAILARFLSPSDFGLIAMVTIFIEVGNTLSDAGMGGALINKKNCTGLDFNTFFVYNASISIILYSTFWMVSPFVANFYDQSILTVIIRILCLRFVIRSVYFVSYLKCLKELRFKAISLITILGASFGLIVGLLMAWKKMQVYSLIGLYISEDIFLCLAYLFIGRYLPKLEFSKKSFTEQFSFGINLLMSNILNTISNNIHTSVIAKVINLQMTGFFQQANKIQGVPVSITTSILDKVLFPILSKNESIEEKRRIYIQVYSITLMAISFISIYTFLYPREIILFALGKQWENAATLLSILSLCIIPLTIQCLCRNSLKSSAETKKIFTNQIAKSLILLAALTTALTKNILYLCISIVAAQILSTALIMKQTEGVIRIGLRKQSLIMMKYLSASLICAFSAKLILLSIHLHNTFTSLLCSFSLSIILYTLGLYILRDKYLALFIGILKTRYNK